MIKSLRETFINWRKSPKIPNVGTTQLELQRILPVSSSRPASSLAPPRIPLPHQAVFAGVVNGRDVPMRDPRAPPPPARPPLVASELELMTSPVEDSRYIFLRGRRGGGRDSHTPASWRRCGERKGMFRAAVWLDPWLAQLGQLTCRHAVHFSTNELARPARLRMVIG
jgi:hypothetical protein